MIVLYETSSVEYIVYVEQVLVAEYGSNNLIGGGGGGVQGQPYYLYIVRS